MQKPGPELILDTNAEADVLSKCCSDDKKSNKLFKSVKNYLKTLGNFGETEIHCCIAQRKRLNRRDLNLAKPFIPTLTSPDG